MNNCIYYFTGTGNSLFIARELSRQTGAQLLPVVGVKKGEPIRADTIGLVFPIYMLNAPHALYSLISQITECSYCYIVITMAGSSGNTKDKIEKMLARQNLLLHAAFSVVMPDNYIVWNEAISDKMQKAATADATDKVGVIATTVTKRERYRDNERNLRLGINNPVPFQFRMMPQPLRQFLCDMGIKYIASMDGAFTVNSRCNGCGSCNKVCPAKNITMKNRMPAWNHHCEQCFACLQWCPQEAIDYGKKTVGKRRYHHPDVTIQELMTQAEASVV